MSGGRQTSVVNIAGMAPTVFKSRQSARSGDVPGTHEDGGRSAINRASLNESVRIGVEAREAANLMPA